MNTGGNFINNTSPPDSHHLFSCPVLSSCSPLPSPSSYLRLLLVTPLLLPLPSFPTPLFLSPSPYLPSLPTPLCSSPLPSPLTGLSFSSLLLSPSPSLSSPHSSFLLSSPLSTSFSSDLSSVPFPFSLFNSFFQ